MLLAGILEDRSLGRGTGLILFGPQDNWGALFGSDADTHSVHKTPEAEPALGSPVVGDILL
jgi:hypothetical protein